MLGRIAVTLGLAVVLSAVGCRDAEERVEDGLALAREARESGRFAEAVIEYRTVLQTDPNVAEAHYELAIALLELGRGKAALWELRETIRLEPDHLDARMRFAWLALAASLHDEALEQAAAVLERDPDHLDAKLVRAGALFQQGDVEASAEAGEAILEGAPDAPRAHYHMAHVRTAQGRLDEAEDHLLRYHALDGGSAPASREVLRFYQASAQHEKAEAFLRQAITSAEPAHRADLALEFAAGLEQRGRLREAEPFLRQALAADAARLDVRERLAASMARDGRVDEALALLREAQAIAPRDADVYRIRGDLLTGAERFQQALAAYQAGLAVAPDSSSLRLREAEALLRLGDIDASRERIRALLADNPDDPMVALAHGRSLALAEQRDEAIAALNELLARDPEVAAAHYLLGVLQLAKNRPEEAALSLEAARIRMAGPEAHQAQRLLAEAQFLSGDFSGAAESAGKALAVNPGDLRSRIILSRSVLELGDGERAEALLREVAEESAQVNSALARIQVKRGRLDRARAEMERAVALEPDSAQWLVDLVWVLRQQGELDEALEMARSRVIEHPEVPDYANLLGQVLVEQGDIVGAQRAFRRSIEADPGFVPGYVNLARLAVRERRYNAARQILLRVLAHKPGDPDALRELGVVEYRKGDPAAAASAFEAALRADPASAATQADLARTRAEAGLDLRPALEAAQLLRGTDPENPEYAATLGLILYRSGLHEAAAEQFRDAIAHAPHAIGVYHYRLALALLETGDRAGARRELTRALEIDSSFEGAEDARKRLADLDAEAGQR